MSKYVGWDESSGGKGKGDAGSQFLKLQAGNKYKLRLVGKAIKYLQHWDPFACRSPGVDAATGQVLDPLMQLGYEPKPRFAIWVLDREDGDRIKVMDFPGSLFDAFKEWKQAHNEEPGGMKGCDWQIKVTPGPGGDKRKTKYSAMHLDRAPFTEDETKRIKEMGDISKKLLEFRRDHTPEEIRALLEEKKKSGVAPSSAVAGKVTTKVEAPAEPSNESAVDF
jgi:hypothetical protein